MTNVLGIDIGCDKYGNLEAKYENLAGMTENHLTDAIAFSAPVLLAQQLSVFKVKQGRQTAFEARDLVDKRISGPLPLSRFFTGIDQQVPPSFDPSIKARVTLISDGHVIRVLVKPKVGLLSKFPEERMSMLVANYQDEVLKMDLGPYTTMVPVAIKYVCQEFFDNFDTTWGFLPDHYNKDMGKKMFSLSLYLYDVWQTKINNLS